MDLHFDFEKKAGKIKPMHAVGQPPFGVADCGIDEGHLHYLQEANIPYARLHDTGGHFACNLFVDIPNLFRDFDADENDPASYDFAFTDALFASMMKFGIEPYFRLGVTIENAHFIRSYRIFPPKDPEKWARICEHIVRHYNEGWADGFHYHIRYWEVWNEPDNEEEIARNNMWKGTAEQYYDLYAATAKHLRACFGDSIRIGGYASTGLYLGYMRKKEEYQVPHEITHWEERAIYHTEFLRGFLERVRKDRLPLDFFSHHSYMSVRRSLEIEEYAEELLAEAGFDDVEIHLNEWNTDRTMETRGTSRAAADVAAMMIAMHATKMSVMCYYDARLDISVYGGLFNPLTRQPFCTYYSFKAFGELYRLGTQTEVRGQKAPVYALAAENGDGTEKAVLLANIGETVRIRTDLSPEFRAYRIDFDHPMTPEELDPTDFELGENQTIFFRTE